ncbi:uncharacterized protein [Lepeophtheirus salmonis]|uniref:uncharacterized protein n=1 Tax=Lepeophtheirus salmonis TaxID=72036 RepID=UPI001AE208D4|nr:neuronal calcium sensor 2-like [Lepeophtheirus salmonis]XP_040563281.1 neuronal calcium sensor 2-like [Lepeophtheirus salmonis]
MSNKFLRSKYFGYKKERNGKKVLIKHHKESAKEHETDRKPKENADQSPRDSNSRNLINKASLPFGQSNNFSGNANHSKTCPPNLLRVLLKQTKMDEFTIHSKYSKFKEEYPTGFIGHSQLSLENKNEDMIVDTIFDICARNKGTWENKLIGFREVILASEMKDNIQGPKSVLQWVFRIYDVHGEGKIKCKDIPNIFQQILRLCTYSDDCNSSNETFNEILRQFPTLTSQENITEEEFIYDALQINKLHTILENSVVLSEEAIASDEA